VSLRLRTALVGIIIAVVSASGAALSSYFLLAARISSDVDSDLATVSSFFLDEVRRSPFADPVKGQDLGAYSVQAVDRNGKILPVAGIELPVVERDIQVALGRVGYYLQDYDINEETWRIRTTSTRYGAIQVALNYDRATEALVAVRAIAVAIALLVATGGAFVSWIITRRATAPLYDLTAAVERVAEGELDVEVSGTGSSEVNRLAGAFNRTMAALRRSRTEQKRIVQDVGHDLRTPLTSLLNNITILKKHQLDKEEYDQVVDDLSSEISTLKRLVDEIIDVASGSSFEEDPEEMDLKVLVMDITLRSRRRYEREVDFSAGDGSCMALVNIQAIERAVNNLIGNAMKYSQGPVEVKVSKEKELVWIDVLDRGIGLQGVDPQLLFQRFWRADSARSSSGSGLGLAIVQEIANQHGGTTRASERDGGGSCIGFCVKSL
jgi:two-component system sensor histidine kinase MprB